MAWTEAQKELCIKLNKAGWSSTQIAPECSKIGPHVTRNAVIGKLHRSGYTGQGPRKVKGPPMQKIPEKTQRPPFSKGPPNAPKKLPSMPAERPKLAASRNLSLLDLKHFDCRWPSGDRSVTFCGAPRDVSYDPACPYCRFHRFVAWSAAPPRKFRPAA